MFDTAVNVLFFPLSSFTLNNNIPLLTVYGGSSLAERAKMSAMGTSNNPLLCGVIRITPVIWVVRWVSFQKRRC
jgi:hypothetical protein